LRTSPDDVLVTEELLHSAVADVFAVRDRRIFGGVIAYRGHLLVAPADAVERLVARFRPFGFTPFLRAEEGDVILQALPLTEPVVRPRIGINIALFVLTCFTTLVSGAFLFASPTFTPLGNSGLVAALLTGAPFAFTLLSILGVHEFGHYFTARYYKAAVSLPYFIPAPPIVLFGTLGAIIRLRSPARDRNSLFDIAAAGPLAGLAIAIPALYVGLQWSVLGKIPSGDVMQFGDPLLLKLLVHLKFGAIPAGMDVFLHPVAVAGWAGFFVTALNLFPLGQLDGGRIAYALFGRHHRLVGFLTFGGLILLGIATQSLNWFVWAALLFFVVGFHHTPPLDDVTPLTTGRRVLGWVCLILLVLLIPPVPIAFS
jgi:membrane-associated protease RseP (regulator of RpoE activity)